MDSLESSESIVARLRKFIGDIRSPASPPSKDNGVQLTILYGKTQLGVPHNHPNILELEAGREKPTQFKECEVLLRGAHRDCVFFQTTIHDSALRNCTLISCTIYGGKIESSRLKDCQFQKKAFGADDTSSRTPFISCCEIEGGAAYDAEIFNSTLNSVDALHFCDIESSLAVHSRGISSTLTSCGVHDSKLHNCDVVGGFLTESVLETKTVLSLRTFPVEIRKMIYSKVIAAEGSATGLIAALRPDALLYGEILETFYRESLFGLSDGVLSDENHTSLNSVPERFLQLISRIRVKAIKIPTSDPSIYFNAGTKLKSITLEFHGNDVNVQPFYDVTKLWFKHFGTVSKFTVEWRASHPWKQGDFFMAPKPPESLKGAVKVANNWLKTEAKLVQNKSQIINAAPWRPGMYRRPTAMKGPEVETFTWTWKATKGEVLTWHSS